MKKHLPTTDVPLEQQKSFLWNRLHQLAKGWIDERPLQFRFRQAKSRWGSCNRRQQSIMLSTRAFLLPSALRDYICVHELAHLRHAHHSKPFWQLISQKLLHWKALRKELRCYE